MYKINRWGAAFLLLAGMACWVCSPLGARAPEKMRANSGQIGQFSREGEYVKDYFVIKKGRTFHLFYNVGVANDTQDWQEPDSEKAFGHATSIDLVHWEHHPRVIRVVPGTWEGQVVSAPSIVKHKGTYYMVYTGFDDRWLGKQTVGLATSKDLFDWKRCPENPVYTAPEWAMRNPTGWEDCRDSHILRYGGQFLMFSMVTTADGKGAIALASVGRCDPLERSRAGADYVYDGPKVRGFSSMTAHIICSLPADTGKCSARPKTRCRTAGKRCRSTGRRTDCGRAGRSSKIKAV